MSGNAERISAPRQRLLAAVLDTLIPSGNGLPSATDVAFDFILSEAQTSLDVAAHVEAVLSRLTDSTSLDATRREAALEQAQQHEPKALADLLRLTYAAYYTDPRVLDILGWDRRPPQPLGHTLAPFDPSMLEGPRRRGKVWRDA